MVRHRLEIVGRTTTETTGGQPDLRVEQSTPPSLNEKSNQQTMHQLTSTPTCENGVCSLNWKPQRPVA